MFVYLQTSYSLNHGKFRRDETKETGLMGPNCGERVDDQCIVPPRSP